MSTDHASSASSHFPQEQWPPLGAPKGLAPVELQSGDCLNREEFHRIYEKTPKEFRAELIEGVVYVASPLKLDHGRFHFLLASVLAKYEEKTPGIQAADNVTVLLGRDTELQPDLSFRILPEHGGQSSTTGDGYIGGPPEFVAEIARSSRSIDLNAKKAAYARYGVREYLVVAPGERGVFWFDLAQGIEHQPDDAGIVRVGVFPGLWISALGLFTENHAMLAEVLGQGLATEEHAAFVKELAQRRVS